MCTLVPLTYYRFGRVGCELHLILAAGAFFDIAPTAIVPAILAHLQLDIRNDLKEVAAQPEYQRAAEVSRSTVGKPTRVLIIFPSL